MSHQSLGYGIIAVVVACAGFPAAASIVYQTGNIQYTNVNIAADIHSFEIAGEVDHSGVMVFFLGFAAAPTYSGIELHGQHGVAFVEANDPAASMYRMTVRAQDGYGFRAMDWKLDAVGPDDGSVTFEAFDPLGNLIPLASGSDTFAFDHNGQNPFNDFIASSFGNPISTLRITSTIPIADLKQVSVDLVSLVPLPSAIWPSLGMLASVGVLNAIRRRRLGA